jgi:uncharacterized membrane-anchored protein YitT (DUF2179 family)
VKKAIILLLASVFLAIGIDFFLAPYHLLEGGMIGVGLIVNYTMGIRTGLAILVLSTPIYLYTLFFQRPFFIKGIHGLLLSSFSIDILEPLKYISHIPLLFSAMFGGIFIGLGIGLMLKMETSAGGLDLLALFIAKACGWNVGILIFFMDSLIILLGYFIAHIPITYSIITVVFVGLMTGSINASRNVLHHIRI